MLTDKDKEDRNNKCINFKPKIIKKYIFFVQLNLTYKSYKTFCLKLE